MMSAEGLKEPTALRWIGRGVAIVIRDLLWFRQGEVLQLDALCKRRKLIVQVPINWEYSKRGTDVFSGL